MKNASWYRLRGNASGRNGSATRLHNRKWACAGCQRDHAGDVSRTQMQDGQSCCDRTYYRRLDARTQA